MKMNRQVPANFTGCGCRKELEGELQGALKAKEAAVARATKLEADLQVGCGVRGCARVCGRSWCVRARSGCLFAEIKERRLIILVHVSAISGGVARGGDGGRR